MWKTCYVYIYLLQKVAVSFFNEKLEDIQMILQLCDYLSAMNVCEQNTFPTCHFMFMQLKNHSDLGERGGSVVECRTPEREVRGSKPTAAVLCPWARYFTPRKYWLITQEAMAPSRHDWKIVDWDVKPQHNQPIPTRLVFKSKDF